MKTKHTPGPWKVVATVDPIHGANPTTYQVVGKGTKGNFARCPFVASTGYHEDSESNARLIAAVPDLLAACKTFLACDGGFTRAQWLGAVRQAQAVISKAEGR